MRIVAAGFRLVDRPDVVIGDREIAQAGVDQRRRRRLGAGNLQQVLMLNRLIWGCGWRMGLLFGSGKALRAVAPLLLLTAVLAAAGLAVTASTPLDVAPLAMLALLGLFIAVSEQLTGSRLGLRDGPCGMPLAVISPWAVA